MTILIIGVVIFAGIHLLIMVAPAVRTHLEARMGAGQWKGIFSLISLVGLGLMIWGWATARAGDGAEPVYIPGDWTRHLAMLLVLIAFILVGASHGKGNIKLWVKQPMSIGIGLWAFAHLMANGTRADVWLFGGFLVVAIVDIVLSTIRGKIRITPRKCVRMLSPS